MPDTLLASKLKAAGVLPHVVELQIAIAKFQNNGGTWSEYLTTGRVAFGKGSDGQHSVADEGHEARVDASRQNESEGHRARAEEVSEMLPTLSAENGAGHGQVADKDTTIVPRPVPRPKRGLGAIASIQSDIAVSLFDSVMLPDGRKIADVPWSELPRVAAEHRRVSRIAMLIHRHAVPVEPTSTAREMLKEDQFAQIIEDAERFNDIA